MGHHNETSVKHEVEGVMKKNIVLGLFLSLILAVPTMAGQQKPLPVGDLEVSADSLGPVVLGQSIEFMLRDGTYVSGKVIRANREEIAVDVKKSEPKARVHGANAIIPTTDISVVYMKKSGSVAAPVALGIVGGVLGLIGGAYVGYAMDSGPIAAIGAIGVAAGGATGGAMLGRAAVRKTLTIAVTAPIK
jgi:hypothetical protein